METGIKNDFQAQVRRQMERLKVYGYREIEAEVSQKRVAWLFISEVRGEEMLNE